MLKAILIFVAGAVSGAAGAAYLVSKKYDAEISQDDMPPAWDDPRDDPRGEASEVF
jgi:hypothetical protein